jgi:site-specific DNA-methyltransferase (adenine-specific)
MSAQYQNLAKNPSVKRVEVIANQTLILGDSLAILPTLGRFSHVISDPPYEASLHAARAHLLNLRKDDGPELKEIDFTAIDPIRDAVVSEAARVCDGWFIAFCTVEGVWKWAEAINASPMKYKRACVWIKPDCTPQLNGQGPAQGAECFVTAWAGKGHARWNAGGKRGVYRHTVNPPDRDGKHPTEKPWRLFVELLTDFTNRGDTILDPFMGSGTTLIACIKTGREGTGIEQDPVHFETACRRVDEASRQPDLFVAPAPPAPTQEVLL